MTVLIERIANELYIDGQRLTLLASELYPCITMYRVSPGIWSDLGMSRQMNLGRCPLEPERCAVFWLGVVARGMRQRG